MHTTYIGGKAVNKKSSAEKLLETAETGLADLSCEELKEIIKAESEKNYENINTDLQK